MADQKKATLILKKIETFDLTVHIAIPPEKPKLRGEIKAEAVARNRDAVKDFRQKILDGEYESDGSVLRDMFKAFHGIADANGEVLEGEDAFEAVINGDFNVYLCGALMDAYFDHFNEARVKTYGTSRRR